MKPKTKRLPKGPISRMDYMTEEVWGNQERVEYKYFYQRADARAFVKQSTADVVRMFRIKFSVVSVKKK